MNTGNPSTSSMKSQKCHKECQPSTTETIEMQDEKDRGRNRLDSSLRELNDSNGSPFLAKIKNVNVTSMTKKKQMTTYDDANLEDDDQKNCQRIGSHVDRDDRFTGEHEKECVVNMNSDKLNGNTITMKNKAGDTQTCWSRKDMGCAKFDTTNNDDGGSYASTSSNDSKKNYDDNIQGVQLGSTRSKNIDHGGRANNNEDNEQFDHVRYSSQDSTHALTSDKEDIACYGHKRIFPSVGGDVNWGFKEDLNSQSDKYFGIQHCQAQRWNRQVVSPLNYIIGRERNTLIQDGVYLSDRKSYAGFSQTLSRVPRYETRLDTEEIHGVPIRNEEYTEFVHRFPMEQNTTGSTLFRSHPRLPHPTEYQHDHRHHRSTNRTTQNNFYGNDCVRRYYTNLSLNRNRFVRTGTPVNAANTFTHGMIPMNLQPRMMDSFSFNSDHPASSNSDVLANSSTKISESMVESKCIASKESCEKSPKKAPNATRKSTSADGRKNSTDRVTTMDSIAATGSTAILPSRTTRHISNISLDSTRRNKTTKARSEEGKSIKRMIVTAKMNRHVPNTDYGSAFEVSKESGNATVFSKKKTKSGRMKNISASANSSSSSGSSCGSSYRAAPKKGKKQKKNRSPLSIHDSSEVVPKKSSSERRKNKESDGTTRRRPTFRELRYVSMLETQELLRVARSELSQHELMQLNALQHLTTEQTIEALDFITIPPFYCDPTNYSAQNNLKDLDAFPISSFRDESSVKPRPSPKNATVASMSKSPKKEETVPKTSSNERKIQAIFEDGSCIMPGDISLIRDQPSPNRSRDKIPRKFNSFLGGSSVSNTDSRSIKKDIKREEADDFGSNPPAKLLHRTGNFLTDEAHLDMNLNVQTGRRNVVTPAFPLSTKYTDDHAGQNNINLDNGLVCEDTDFTETPSKALQNNKAVGLACISDHGGMGSMVTSDILKPTPTRNLLTKTSEANLACVSDHGGTSINHNDDKCYKKGCMVTSDIILKPTPTRNLYSRKHSAETFLNDNSCHGNVKVITPEKNDGLTLKIECQDNVSIYSESFSSRSSCYQCNSQERSLNEDENKKQLFHKSDEGQSFKSVDINDDHLNAQIYKNEVRDVYRFIPICLDKTNACSIEEQDVETANK